MVSRVRTVAFQGIEAVPVDVQVMIAPGKAGMHIVGLPDKAVAESRERVRAALHASGLSMPTRRVTVNLAPADLPKEGSHYDLPIALGLMAGLGAIPSDAIDGYVVLGELSLDGTIAQVAGALPAAIGAHAQGRGLICPHSSGPEAAWAGSELDILAPRSLIALANHFHGSQVLSPPVARIQPAADGMPDLSEIRGQESAKRALEVAAAGGHNFLMVGPPGSGKSMLAQRLPSLLPPLLPRELLDVSMVASIAGALAGGRLSDRRPFRAPHHSASMAAMIGGGHAGEARRSVARPSRRALPRRVPGILASGPRLAAPAAGEWRVRAGARQPPRHLSGQAAAGRRHEPLPMRHGRGARLSLPTGSALPDRLRGAAVGAAARPHRPQGRGAGHVGGRAAQPAQGGAEHGGGGTGGVGAGRAAAALRGARPGGIAQRALPALAHPGRRRPGRSRHGAAQGGQRQAQPVGPGIPPGA